MVIGWKHYFGEDVHNEIITDVRPDPNDNLVWEMKSCRVFRHLEDSCSKFVVEEQSNAIISIDDLQSSSS
ncbi:hypothetical protein Tco_0370362 [Tanacetum coccineum]